MRIKYNSGRCAVSIFAIAVSCIMILAVATAVRAQDTNMRDALSDLFSRQQLMDKINAIHQPVKRTGNIFSAIDNDVLGDVAQEYFFTSFEKSKVEGADIESGISPNWEYRRNHSLQWVLLRQVGGEVPWKRTTKVVSKDAIQDNIRRDLASLGFTESEVLSDMRVEVRTLRGTAKYLDGTIDDHAMAYIAYIKRYIDGVEVLGSRIVMAYNLDGSLHRISLHWPEYNSVAAPMMNSVTMNGLLSEVELKLQGHSLRKHIDEMDVRVAYSIVDGQLTKTVVLSAQLNGPSPDSGFISVLHIPLL